MRRRRSRVFARAALVQGDGGLGRRRPHPGHPARRPGALAPPPPWGGEDFEEYDQEGQGEGYDEYDPEQLQDDKYKTEMCRNWVQTGTCRYGDKCQFAHGYSDMRARRLPAQYKTRVCRTSR